MNQTIKYSRTTYSPPRQTLSPKINPLVTADYIDNKHVINPVSVLDKNSRLAVRSKIDNYESALKELTSSETGDADEINENGLKEYFVNGSYVRELFIPIDTTIVSQIWKKERMWIIATGEVTFTTEMGTKRIKAPYTEVVPAGSKVALYTHENTLWFAITGTSTDNIEDEVIAKDYSDVSYPWDKLGE